MATTLAKAYVQIVPSAEGISDALKDALGGSDVSAAGETAGQSIGSRLVGTLKKVIVAAGIGKIISSSLTAGADLQQSIGGIETLFKDSADTMKEYASQAYMTAGLSANDYMEQSTSFAASLLQSLDGDTAAAAESANQAIIDMSDNANKMGTNIEDIQNAYQGFAKQNYTMLDNLKLGYGGTKEEMQRLLEDAEKLTGVKYDISNLDDVYQAIHVIQEDLDITGTTAKEASETFSGSLASMKAAGTNLLANLSLGEDIRPSLDALMSTVQTFVLNNMIPMVANIISGLPTMLGGVLSMAVQALNIAAVNADEIVAQGVQLISTLITGILSALPQIAAAAWNLLSAFASALLSVDWVGTATNMIFALQSSLSSAASEIIGTDGSIIDAIGTAIQNYLPQILEKGVETISTLANGILQALPTAVQAISNVISELLGYILDSLPSILSAGVQLLKNLARGILNSLPDIASAAGSVISNLLSNLLSHLPDLLQTGITLLGELIAGLINSIPDIISAAGEIISNFFQAFTEVDWGQIGKNIIDGIVNGLKNFAGNLWDAAKGLASNALNGLKGALGISSPSKVMAAEVGRYIPSGIAEGIRKNTSPLTDEMKTLTKKATGVLQADVTASLAVGKNYAVSGMNTQPAGGYTQNITVNSPTALSPYEVARQTRIATQNMVLAIKGV